MSMDKKESGRSGAAQRLEGGFVEGLIEALANKHAQLDINFDKTGVRVLGMPQIGVELNGSITLKVHMRELSEEEKKALASRNVALATA
jgi:hypothetical protein